MLFVDLNDNFSCKGNYNLSQRRLIMFCVRPLCELQLFAAPDASDICHHHSGTDMAISLFHFQSFSYAAGEIVSPRQSQGE